MGKCLPVVPYCLSMSNCFCSCLVWIKNQESEQSCSADGLELNTAISSIVRSCFEQMNVVFKQLAFFHLFCSFLFLVHNFSLECHTIHRSQNTENGPLWSAFQYNPNFSFVYISREYLVEFGKVQTCFKENFSSLVPESWFCLSSFVFTD